MTDIQGRDAGRCATHDDLAWRYPDSRVACMTAGIVAADPTGCRWVPMPSVWLPSQRRQVTHLRNRMFPDSSACGHLWQVDPGDPRLSDDDVSCLACRRTGLFKHREAG